jgi:sugar phosphate isomerase/epimerase
MPKLEIGVVVRLDPEARGIAKVADLGLRSCQVASWDPAKRTPETAGALREACRAHGVRISSLWAGYPGPVVWNFIDGPKTIGLVPPEYRAERVAVLQRAAEYAASLELPSITTHVGFLPEDPGHPEYAPTVEAIGRVAGRCRELGIGFWFETGQETPVTLLRTIERVGLPNVGVNLDTANLILYGKGDPVDALDVLGRHVRGVHVKDGRFPTDGDHLGRETPPGEGLVDFAAVIGKLKSLGYTGALTIEREISGPQQVADIRKAIALLEPLC